MAEDDEFLVWQWVDGCVVFDRLLGSTHALHTEALSTLSGGDIKQLSAAQIRAAIYSLQSTAAMEDVPAQRTDDPLHQPLHPAVKFI